MKWLLGLWATPLALFWGWYFVSLNDWNFGYVVLSRQFHDLLFQLYGEILGVDPGIIPMMLAKTFAFDSLLVAAIVAYRKRRAIAERVRAWRARYSEVEEAPSPSA